jgi:protocatechuate 3,4-dioxygenase beta subunit
MRRLTSSLAISALLLLTSARAQAPAAKKPPASDPQSAQKAALDKEPRLPTRIQGRVITEGGRPVSDATIMVFPVNVAGNVQSAITSLFRPATSDADGKFELASLRPGAYTLSASAPGYVISEGDSKTFYRPGDNATISLVKGCVITGRVTSLTGDPVIGALVKAIKVRDADNRPTRVRANIASQISDSVELMLGPFRTDDRGIYRIYGLTPGYYQVAAGGRAGQGFSFGAGNTYDGDAPTYYPSSTMETASDVTVRAGEEAGGIDIRYRENRGHSIGGTVSVSAGPAPSAISVFLTRAGSGALEATTIVMPGRDHFGFDTLLDGEYVVSAMSNPGNMELAAGAENMTASVSQPRRVTLRGADVSGISLVIEPLASIAGRVVVEPIQDAKQKALCKEVRPVPIEGTVLGTRYDTKETIDPLNGPLGAFKNTTPNEKSEFIISLLRAGRHYVDVQLPAEHLYLRAIALQPPDPKAKAIDAVKSGVQLKSGDKITGVVVTVGEGAAKLSGTVITDPANKPPEAKMRVHLVPVEPDAAEDVLRYFEADVSAEGGFAFTNLQPGKYWLVGRETSDSEQGDADRKAVALDAGARTALRFEGEASGKVIQLTYCQIVGDYRLKYVPLIKPSKPPAKKAGQ